MPHAAGLYWESHGPADAPALILSTGLGGSGAYWQPNLAALAARHRVILYDHRGTGRSDCVLPDVVTVEDMADDILALMDGIGLSRADIMGHAAGGVAGLALALKAPERLGKLVVVNGWARPDPHFARCFVARLALFEQGGAEAYLRAQPIFLYPANWISGHHAEIEAELPGLITHFQGEAALRARISALRAFDIGGRLDEIRIPTLAIAAEDDMLVPSRCSDVLAEGIEGARLARMPRGGHACNVTHPPEFDGIVLDFLSGSAA